MKLKKEYDNSGTREYIEESREVIIREERLNMKSDNDNDKDKSHPIFIIGSNNVIGKNVFLINTGSDEETVQEVLEHFSPEFIDKFIFTVATNAEKKTN